MRTLSKKEREAAAKQMEKTRQSEWETEICWHCKHKKWRDYFENLDLDGIPITLDCEFRKPDFGHILRSEPACPHFSRENCE